MQVRPLPAEDMAGGKGDCFHDTPGEHSARMSQARRDLESPAVIEQPRQVGQCAGIVRSIAIQYLSHSFRH